MSETAFPVAQSGDVLDVKRLMELLPHRYPMLMIDRVVDVEPGESATGVKNVTYNEPFFPGHFPGHPVMPGVFLIEAMAQTAAALVSHTLGEETRDKVVYFMTVDRARFRHPVVPGDQVLFPVHKVRRRSTVWKFAGQAMVGDQLCAESEFSAMLMDR